jgi:hypothetical protein
VDWTKHLAGCLDGRRLSTLFVEGAETHERKVGKRCGRRCDWTDPDPLLVVGGVGFYYLNSRQQMALAAAELARAEEARARMIAVEARAETERAAASRALMRDQSSSSVGGDAICSAAEAVLRTQEDAWNRGYHGH